MQANSFLYLLNFFNPPFLTFMKEKAHKKRWRFYIDKPFQNKFIVGYSFIIIINALSTLGVIWLVRNKSYNLLPNNAPVLVHVDSERAISLRVNEEENVVIPDDNGEPFFPLKKEEAHPRLFNAFDLYFIPILFTSILNIVVISIFNLFFSHKMAGPLYNMEKSLKNYIAGHRIHPIRLRKGDMFQELADLINQSLDIKNGKKDETKK